MNLLLNYLAPCLFRKNPAQLIPSKAFMWKNVSFYLISGIIVESLIADPADGTLEVLLRTFMAFSTIAIFLALSKQWPLMNQLYTSIFVCENFIITLAIAAEGLDHWMILIHYPLREQISISLAIFLVVWYIAIVSYIFRKFFAYRTVKSIVYAFSYFVLTYGLPMLFMDI